MVCLAGTPVAALAAPSSQGVLTDAQLDGTKLNVTLTLPDGQTGASLGPGSLRASVGGASATVSLASLGQGVRTSILVIDTSGSMGQTGIAAATQAAKTYLASAPADVLVGLITFSNAPVVLVPPTVDRAAAVRALGDLRAAGETTLYDALQLAVRQLGTIGSRNLVLLSDGGDSKSKATLPAVLAAIKAAGARTEVVGFKTGGSQNSVLTSIAQAGQGKLVAADGAAALGLAFGNAAKALEGQVRLSVTVPRGVEGSQPLVVTALLNGQPLVASTQALVHGGVIPTPTARSSDKPQTIVSQTAPAPAGVLADRKSIWAIGAVVFLSLLVVCLFIVSPIFVSASRRRLGAIEGYVNGAFAQRQVTVTASPSAVSAQMLQLSARVIKNRSGAARSALLLERADLPVRANEWYVLRLVAVVVFSAVGWLLMHGSFAVGLAGLLLGGATGLFAPAIFLRLAAGRRARQFDRQLPDVLTLVASSLSTGFSLPQAIDAIVSDASEPSSKEFGRALAETRIGAELEDTLDRIAVRMDSRNLEWTTMAIRVQRQVGGSLAETLRTTAHTLRERESLKREVAALSAEGKLSAGILIALPIGMFIYMAKVNYDYVSLLWTTGIGIGMLVVSVVGLVVGVFWMRKVVQVVV
jgi:tight adherence protein B